MFSARELTFSLFTNTAMRFSCLSEWKNSGGRDKVQVLRWCAGPEGYKCEPKDKLERK